MSSLSIPLENRPPRLDSCVPALHLPNQQLSVSQVCQVIARSLCFAWIMTMGLQSRVVAQSQAIEWQTGAAIEKTVDEITSIDWTDQTLPLGFRTLETTFRMPIVRDRRVDPRRRLTVSSQNRSLEETISVAAAAAELESTVLPWGIYVGPSQVPDRAATAIALLRNELQQAPAADRRRLSRETPASWPRLSQPSQLVQAIAEEYQVQIAGIDTIPYDLWDARDLPKLDFVDRLSLILASFDLTFRWIEMGKRVELIALPAALRFPDTYSVSGGRTPPLNDWRTRYPQADFKVSGNRIEVEGTWNAHREVQRWIADRRRPSSLGNAPAGERRYTLRIPSATLGEITDYLGKQLEMEFVWSAAAEAKRDTRTMLQVQDATLDAMLRSIFKDAGLTHKIEGKRVLIEVSP